MGKNSADSAQASPVSEHVTTAEAVPASSAHIHEQPVKKSDSGNLSAKKRLGIVVVLLVVVMAVIALASRFIYGSVELTDYTSDKQGFSVMYPSGWTVDVQDTTSDPSTIFSETYNPNDPSGGTANPAVLTVEKLNTGLPKDVFFQTYGGVITEAVTQGKNMSIPDAEYPISSNQKEGTINGHDALLVEADVDNFQYAEGLKGKKYVAHIWIDSSLQYVVTLIAKKSDQKIVKQWDSISSTFTVQQ